MRRFAFIVAAGLALSACASYVPPAPETPEQAVFLAKSTYAVTLSTVAGYEALPRCGVGAPKVCSDPVTVDVIRKADDVAYAVLNEAEALVRTPGVAESKMLLAIEAAKRAVSAFEIIVKRLDQ